MTRENINTIIASVGLVIALITAWKQFGPSPDRLDIEVTGRVELSAQVNKTGYFPELAGEKSQIIAGPFFWKAVIYNELDRPVTIKEIETLMISKSGGLIDYSDMEVGIYSIDKSPVQLPLSIQSRHAQAIVIGLNIPVIMDPSTDGPCFNENRSKRDIEVCYFSKGVDFFGNEVSYTEIPNPDGDPFVSVSWPNGIQSPEYLTRIITGDNTELSVRYQYYPSLK